MAILGSTALTLIDIARRLGGEQPILVDAITNENAGTFYRTLPMRQVTGWIERFTRIDGRPTVAFRRLGEYIDPSKSNRNPYSEGVFLLSGASEVDKVTADRDPRGALVLRQEEDWSFLEALGNKLSDASFYNRSSVSDDGFDGLLDRMPSGYDTTVDAGALTSSAQSSIYAFKFGPGRFMGLYNTGPNGKIIEANDYGAVVDKNSSNALNEIYRTFFNAAFGLAQYHPRAIGRIGGINAANKPAAADFTSLYEKMYGKPDLYVCSWRTYGYLGELISAYQHYPPGVRDYVPYAGFYDGVPILVDAALSDAEENK